MGCVLKAAQLSFVWSRPLPANTSPESICFPATVPAAPSNLHWQNRNLISAHDTSMATGETHVPFGGEVFEPTAI